MKILVLAVWSIAAVSADVSHLTGPSGYSYSKPISSVSVPVQQLYAAPAPLPAPVVEHASAPSPIQQSFSGGGALHGSLGSISQPDVIGHSLGQSIDQSYGSVAAVESSGSIGQSFDQSYASVGQSHGSTGSIGHLYGPPESSGPAGESHSAIGDGVTAFHSSGQAPLSSPAAGPTESNAYLPPEPEHHPQGPVNSYSGSSQTSGHSTLHHSVGLLGYSGSLSGYHADDSSLAGLSNTGSATSSGHHTQGTIYGSGYQNEAHVSAQTPAYSDPAPAPDTDHGAVGISGPADSLNSYLPPSADGQAQPHTGTSGVISAPDSAPLLHQSAGAAIEQSGHLHSFAGDENLSSSNAAPLITSAPQGEEVYALPASQTGGYHYNAPV